MRVRPLWRLHALATGVDAAQLRCTLAGVGVRNPVGLAAGFDKRCEHLASLADLGFGYLVCGTITRHPRPGNAKPRLLRVPREQALINALGFPGDGVEAAQARLRRYAASNRAVPVVASIAALGDDDTVHCLAALEPYVAAVELNISSPNTQGVREYQDAANLKRLLDALNARRTKPLFVKLPPWRDDAGREAVLGLVRTCAEAGVAGVTAFNTMPVEDPRLATGAGGLSGRPLLGAMVKALPDIRREVGPAVAIHACGGIGSASDASLALEAGADSVQLYTALVYDGPGVVNGIVAGLSRDAAARGKAA